MLEHTVIIAGHGPSAEIGACAHFGVTHIGQVVDLRALIQTGILDFHEIAHADIFGQFRTGAQAGIGADDGTCADMAAFKVAEGADRGTAFHSHTGAKDDIGLDDRVAAQKRVLGEDDCVGGRERHAIVQGCGTRAGLEQAFRAGELRAGVDAKRFGFRARHDSRAQALRAAKAHDIGQVIFACGVRVAHLRDQVKERRAVRADHTGIAQPDGALRVACVFPFDDGGKVRAIQHEPPVAARIGGFKAQHDNIRACTRGLQCLQRFGGDEGRVAIKHDHIACDTIKGCARLCHGMGRAKLFVLAHDQRIGVFALHHGCDLIAAMAHDHDHARGIKCRARAHRMHDQRGGRQGVQDLGQVGLHPAALPCGQYHKRNRLHLPCPVVLAVLPQICPVQQEAQGSHLVSACNSAEARRNWALIDIKAQSAELCHITIRTEPRACITAPLSPSIWKIARRLLP